MKYQQRIPYSDKCNHVGKKNHVESTYYHVGNTNHLVESKYYHMGKTNLYVGKTNLHEERTSYNMVNVSDIKSQGQPACLEDKKKFKEESINL